MRGWSLIAFSALAMGPFEKNHPLVDDGEAAYQAGDYEGALSKFEAADKELPNNAQIAFDRGTALHQLGRHEEARAAFLKAAELNQGKQPLDSKIHYNLGNSWAATSNKKEAVAEYRKTLRRDPNDEQARHNLEVILKDLPPPRQSGADGGSPDSGPQGDAGRPDSGPDGGKPSDAGTPKDGGTGDGGQGDAGSDGGSDGGQGQGDGGRGDGGQGDGGQGKADGGSSNAGEQDAQRGDGGRADAGNADADAGASEGEAGEAGDGGEELSKKDAERMLDSLKNTERNLQMWRFRQDKKRKANEKDW